MNKKGYDYAALLLLIVLMGLTILFVQVQTKFNQTTVLGQNQYELLKYQNDIKLFEQYLSQASKNSFDSALLDVLGANIIYSENEIPTIQECTLPNLPTSFEPKLTEKFNNYLNEYLRQYNFASGSVWQFRENNFLIGQKENDIIISAFFPMTYNFPSKNGAISYKPIIKIDRANKLQEYHSWADTLKTIEQNCNNTPDPPKCAEIYTNIQNWRIHPANQQNAYQIIIPLSKQQIFGNTIYESICFNIKLGKVSL